MKRLLMVIMTFLLVASLVMAGKTFTGYAGHLADSIGNRDTNLETNWEPGEIPLSHRGSGSFQELSLSKTVKKDSFEDFRPSKRKYLAMVGDTRYRQYTGSD